MNVIDVDIRKSSNELRVVQGVVGASCDNNLGLLFEVEVTPGERGVHVLLVQSKALVVRDGAYGEQDTERVGVNKRIRKQIPQLGAE